MTTNGSAKNDRQLLVVLPIALVVGIAYVAWGATFPTTAQVTVCEKIVSTSVTEKSVKLLTGDTLKVDRAIYDELEPLTTYVVEERWFREPVFKAKADGAAQEGNRCWNVP
jgi:hypothetical protein